MYRNGYWILERGNGFVIEAVLRDICDVTGQWYVAYRPVAFVPTYAMALAYTRKSL